MTTFLSDALRTGRAGVIASAYASRLLLTDDAVNEDVDAGVAGVAGGKAVRGVLVQAATATGGGGGGGGGIDANGSVLEIEVLAARVCVCAGTLHTPALLLRSGLDGGGQVGDRGACGQGLRFCRCRGWLRVQGCADCSVERLHTPALLPNLVSSGEQVAGQGGASSGAAPDAPAP